MNKFTLFDTHKHWRQKLVMQQHILPQTSPNDQVCGKFKTPLHLSAPQQPCTRHPWTILITDGSGGTYSMGLHTTKQSARGPFSVNMEWDQAWRSPPAHSHSLGAPIQ